MAEEQTWRNEAIPADGWRSQAIPVNSPDQPVQEPQTLSERAAETLRFVGGEFKQIGGLALRAPVEAVSGTGAGLVDLAARVGNYGIDALDWAGQAVGDKPLDYRFPTDRSQRNFEDINRTFPSPRNRAEEYALQGSEALVGAGTGVGIGGQLTRSASPVSRGVGDVLQSTRGLQGTAAVTGSAAADVAEDLGAGPVGQTAAGVAGALVPAAPTAGAAALRGTLRGGESGRQQLTQNIDEFTRAGTAPTVAQGTERRVAQATEGLASRSPGGAGRMAATAERQADDVGAMIEQRAQELAGRTSAETTGRRITEGVRGEGGFLERFRGVQRQLWNRLDEFIEPGTASRITGTRRVMNEMTSEVVGAEQTSQQLRNPALRAIADALRADTRADGTIPFSALRAVREMVGERIAAFDLSPDISDVEWRRLYGAISSDLEAAARNTNNPAAIQAWSRANRHTQAGHNRIDTIRSVINRNGGGEKVFQAAISGTKEGATVLRAVMQSLDDEGQRSLSATIMRRLGRATPGTQNELGDVFSMERFLTNWNGLSNEAKNTLFNRYGPRFRQNMDSIASVAANMRQGSQAFRNPSGTAQAVMQGGTAGTFILALMNGQIELAGGIAAAVFTANRTSALMTNPNFVRWLAQTTEMPQGAMPAQINVLATMARQQGNEDMAYVVAALEQATEGQ